MHIQVLKELIDRCRQREQDGDNPRFERPSPSMLEDAVLDLASDNDRLREKIANMEQHICDECSDGYKEDRAGVYVCACVSEMKPYIVLSENAQRLIVLAEGTANMLRGMMLDPSIPKHAKDCMADKISTLETHVAVFSD